MADDNTPEALTPKHVRAARALLAWSQRELAKAADVATSTVADFERGQRTPVANNAQAIRKALENAGIRFLPTGAVIGPAVPALKLSARSGAPVRWVSAEDLSSWADRIDGAASLPRLISHLIRATLGAAVQLRFPSDEGIRYSGWDGRTSTEVASLYVPQGEAAWEISAQRSAIPKKATRDYAKRTVKPAPVDPTEAAFVFVTPRHWPKKDVWAKACQEEGPWREVRAYDANDLVHWIEQTPAVGLWLAVRLGKRPPGTRELDEVWKEWSLATQWPLTEDLVLSDRDRDAAEVHRWLRGAPSVLSLQATTTDEVVAFFHSTLTELPDDHAAAYRTRCLVATTADAARALGDAPSDLILLLTDPEPGLAQSLVQRRHHVLQAYDQRGLAREGEVRTLARPSREGIAGALIAAGIAEPRAHALARDSARNLAALRRLMPVAPGRLPKWADEPPSRALLAALLAGGWNEDIAADRARLSELADQPYEAITAALASYLSELDSPLQKVGSLWRIASPSDAWFLLAHHLTGTEIHRFEATAYAVLGSVDPRFDMDPNERWMAEVHRVRQEYSGMLRHGIGQTLILLGLWGERVRAVADASRRVDTIVSRLLRDADQRRWWSLSGDFRLLAEASPSAFLAAIEDSLDQDDPPIAALFDHDEDGVFGTEYLSGLIGALETLAWSPDWMPRVTLVLARLDAIDTKPRHNSDGLGNSLREIHTLGLPQTYASLDQRLRALDLVRKQVSGTAWKLMVSLLPSGDTLVTPSPMPYWRDFSVDVVESVTWGLIRRAADAISERLLADAGLSPERWSDLLDHLGDLSPDPEAALAALEAAEPQIADKAGRASFWGKLRRVLNHHRQYPDARWSLPEAVLGRLEALYDRFAPSDPRERRAWLFAHSVQLPKLSREGWEAEDRDLGVARQQAALSLYAEGGPTAVLALARLAEAAGYLGKALFDGGLPAADIDSLLEAAVRSEHPRERDLAHGLIASMFRERKHAWAADLVAKATNDGWGDTALLTILRALPVGRWTWEQAARIGGDTEAAYWRQAPVLWVSEEAEDIAYAIRSLIKAGRARHALALAGHRRKVHLPSSLLIELLQEAARAPFENGDSHNEATMFKHSVAEILQSLDESDDVDEHALAALEWTFLSILENSRRPPKVLLRALSNQPALFVQMLSAVFNASEESGVLEPEPEDPERARVAATQAYRLLKLWNHIPGTRDDGTIDGKELEMWIKEARAMCNAVGRGDIGDSQIGNLLSASPVGADGHWPAEPVREVIDLFRSKPMIGGFQVGKRNRRGITARMPRAGGDLERREATKYRAWAKAIEYEHPHTARALESIAEGYEWEAHQHDESAERLDWQP